MSKLNLIIKNLKKYTQLSKKLYSDKRTPLLSKIFSGLAIFYLVSPIDLIPDFIPIIGQMDDLFIVPLFLIFSFKIIPKNIYTEHYNKIFKNMGSQ